MRVKIPTRDKLTAKMRKAVDEEAQSAIDRLMPQVVKNVEAVILWQLHVQCGFGKKRLMKFFAETSGLIENMLSEYSYDTDEDAIWLCKRGLREIGIDLDSVKGPFSADVKLK